MLLLERDGALEAVATILERARMGFGGALFLLGEAGLGKTSVLATARDLAAAASMDVGFARGELMEGAVAFGLLTQSLAAASGREPEWLHERALEPSAPYYRTLRWLEQRGGRPLLLAIDDLHWADEDSLRVFTFLVRRLHGFPVALLATLRPWPPSALAAARELAQAGHARLEQLEPLGRQSIDALLADAAGVALEEAEARRAFSLCGGNPLLARQLALAIVDGQHVPRAESAGKAVAGHLLLSRFAGIDDEGLRLARAASVLGTTFRVHLAAAIAGLDDDQTDRGLEALYASGLISDDGELLRFEHPLFAQALYEDQPFALRRRLHARAARVLAAHGLEELAGLHALRSGSVGDQDAIDLLERLGRGALEAGAVASAVRHLEGAVLLSAERPATALQLTYAQALCAAGRVERAAEVCERLVRAPDLEPQDQIEVLRLLGRARYLGGAGDHGARALERAVEIGLGHDPAAAVQPLLDHSLSVWLEAGPARALPLAAKARELAASASGPVRERAEATWASYAVETGDPSGVDASERFGARLHEGKADFALSPDELAWPYSSVYAFAITSKYVERFQAAEDALRRARAVMDRAGAADALASLAIHMAHTMTRRGRLEQSLTEAELALQFADLTPGVLPYAELARAEALAWLGEFERSEEHCAAAERQAGGQWFARLWIAHVRGMRMLWQGDPHASDELLEAERVTGEAGVREPCVALWQAHAVAAHLASGRDADAQRVTEWLEECARPLPCRWPRIAAELGRALIAERAGADDAAHLHYGSALELFDHVDLPLQRIEALLWHGGFLRRQRHLLEARSRLAEALQLAERVGASWLAHAAHAELGLARGRRRRAAETRDGLTGAERRVVELAARGLSNREIAGQLVVSVNTVQTHLKHAYAKLGVSSRHQLRERVRAS